MKKILLYGLSVKDAHVDYIDDLLKKLSSYKAEIALYSELEKEFKKFDLPTDYPIIGTHQELNAFNADVVFTLGGDGTILNAALLIKSLEIPVLGINLGRLGFLASIEDHKLTEAIAHYFDGKYSIQNRAMLEMISEPHIFGDSNFALNDCTIVKRDTSSMITVHTYINGNFLNSYWADGLIISTATGSTGYSLSGGGPIMFPESNNFLITPVAPHNLTARPVVFSDDAEITLRVEGRSENFLCTLDSRYETITSEHKITLRRSKFNTKLIKLEGDSFMKTIRNKLAWGLDKRN